MARKEKIVTIQDRDQSLTFKIREMPATKLERWIMRALLLLAGSGVDITPQEAGKFLAKNGVSSFATIDFEKAEPLLQELLTCCSRVIENVEELCTPESVDNYILDVTTLFTLRKEVLALNLGFLQERGGNLFGFLGKQHSEMQSA